MYKDTLKQTLKLTGIYAETWHELAEDWIRLSNKFLVPTLYVRHVAEPANQG